jgi:hypothetical protein
MLADPDREGGMAECDEDFEKARVAFRKAAEANCIPVMRNYAVAGLRFLDRADTLSAVVEAVPESKCTPSMFED